MNTNKQCNHAEAIAKEMYITYVKEQTSFRPSWEGLTTGQRNGWLAVAEQALPIIGKHALWDVRDYLTGQPPTTTGWKKALYWAGGIILAGVIGGGAMTLSGCGAAANLSLSSEQGQLSVSRTADGSIVVSAVPPVIQPTKK